MPGGTVGSTYNQSLAASGGSGTGYTWALEPGSTLPGGLTLTTAGLISGQPTAAGGFSFTVRVTDSQSNTTVKTLSITITTGGFSITTASLPNWTVGINYNQTLLTSGGTSPFAWAVIAGTDLGRAIRAVARERQGSRLVGIDVEHIYAMTFGIGTACVAAAACLLLPSFYVTPQAGYAFVLIAFTTVVLGGMGSFTGALVGGLVLGVVEAVGGLTLGESLGQIGIFLIFILVLMFRPTGLFGSRAA